ncbi:phage Gp37/Gp68 family protein [Alicyclobacillus sp. ALC3]|uniref:phage Gp37/Gp68 family protein n=1 Tax=Alicyclobacillus sp. ALC3 TaxID=2796143 RepID=UPI00237951A5|nr:phage Gp37/Gp68 family protein [Alicyclobacillus sp. ALC3]WDL99755.1 DUF5131 family protein [Alicyclobacillus sp. ALC3]
MANQRKEGGIGWTDETWNPVTGCSKVSAGCTHCYAEKVSHRFGFTSKPWNAAYAAENVQLHYDRLGQPLKWKQPRRIFVNSMSDLFHEQVPDNFIRKVFQIMGAAEQHTFQVLTKRPGRMKNLLNEWFNERDFATLTGSTEPPFPWPNVWLGVSVENQQAVDERIPLLLQTPAAARFLSCEPLLGPVDLGLDADQQWVCPQCGSVENHEHIVRDNDYSYFKCNKCGYENDNYESWGTKSPIDWVIVGGESGPNARPMSPWWARDLRDQCVEAGVSFFFKQWGEFAPVHELRCNEPGIKGKQWVNFDPDTSVCRVGRKNAGRVLDGRVWDEYPRIGGNAVSREVTQ